MITKKELTIKELFVELRTLYARLIRLAEKYNKALITVSAISYKDIIAKSSGKKGDRMLNNEIKKESLNNEFDIVKASYDSYREEAIEKIREMIANKSMGYCIVYFRDQLHWKWKDICKLFNYSRAQAYRIYEKSKNETT